MKLRTMIGMFHDNGQNTEYVGNVAAGSERSGYSGYGIGCSSNKTLPNEATSCLSGYWFDGTYIGQKKLDCVKLSSFIFWKMYLFAVYGEIGYSSTVSVNDISVADARIGVHIILKGTSALQRELVDKVVHISNSLLVGASKNNNGCMEKIPSMYTCSFFWAYCEHLNLQVCITLIQLLFEFEIICGHRNSLEGLV
jgi:hypothetical protein